MVLLHYYEIYSSKMNFIHTINMQTENQALLPRYNVRTIGLKAKETPDL